MKEKQSAHLRIETENLAVPEVHVSERTRTPEEKPAKKKTGKKKLDVRYDNLAIPEIVVEEDE